MMEVYAGFVAHADHEVGRVEFLAIQQSLDDPRIDLVEHVPHVGEQRGLGEVFDALIAEPLRGEIKEDRVADIRQLRQIAEPSAGTLKVDVEHRREAKDVLGVLDE